MPTTDLTATLVALLEHWNKLAVDAAQKVAVTSERTQRAYCAGVMFGVEAARDDLAVVLAHALASQMTPD